MSIGQWMQDFINKIDASEACMKAQAIIMETMAVKESPNIHRGMLSCPRCVGFLRILRIFIPAVNASGDVPYCRRCKRIYRFNLGKTDVYTTDQKAKIHIIRL